MPKGKREKKIQAQERKNQFAEAEPHGGAKDFGKYRKVKINRATVI